MGDLLSSKHLMSPSWDFILKKEELPITKLMINSLSCLVILMQQFKHKFLELKVIWVSFCSASKMIVNHFLQYLNQFKEVYLGNQLLQPGSQVKFKSPWVSGLIVR